MGTTQAMSQLELFSHENLWELVLMCVCLFMYEVPLYVRGKTNTPFSLNILYKILVLMIFSLKAKLSIVLCEGF